MDANDDAVSSPAATTASRTTAVNPPSRRTCNGEVAVFAGIPATTPHCPWNASVRA